MKTIVFDLINDKKNGLGIQEQVMLMYNYMMNQKMKKKEIDVKDIIDVKDSFLVNMKSVNYSNQHIKGNLSYDNLSKYDKLNNSDINNILKASQGFFNNNNLNASKLKNGNINLNSINNVAINNNKVNQSNIEQSLRHVKLEDISLDDSNV
jgi:hypothetical protein